MAELAERSPIIIQNSSSYPSSQKNLDLWPYGRPYKVLLLTCVFNPGSSPSRGKAFCPWDVREKKIRSPLLSLAKSIHYFNHFVCPYGPALSAMGGIMKVIVSFFFSEKAKKSQSNSTVAGFRSTKIITLRYSNLKNIWQNFWDWRSKLFVWNWWLLAEALSSDKIVHGQVRELCYSNRWAVPTRTAKFNIWWRQQWTQRRAHDTLSLLWKWFTCKHIELLSPQAEFFPSASLSKCSNNSINALKFLINISEKTKANDRALECLFNILNPYVTFRLY